MRVWCMNLLLTWLWYDTVCLADLTAAPYSLLPVCADHVRVFSRVPCYTPQRVCSVCAIVLEKGLQHAITPPGVRWPTVCAFCRPSAPGLWLPCAQSLARCRLHLPQPRWHRGRRRLHLL